MFWPTAIVALILFGIGKAGFGGGVGILAVPLLSLMIPVSDAAALLLPLLIIMDLLAVRHYYHTFDRKSIYLLVPGATVGIAIGGLFFGYLEGNEGTMRIGIGVLALLFVLFQVSRALIFGKLEKLRLPDSVGIGLGVMTGFTSTLAHAGGPPASVYLLPQQLSRQIFVGTTVMLFTLINLIKLIPYGILGLLHISNLATILLLAPFCYLGVWIGISFNGKVSEVFFNRLVYSLLFLTGLELVTGGNLLNRLFIFI